MFTGKVNGKQFMSSSKVLCSSSAYLTCVIPAVTSHCQAQEQMQNRRGKKIVFPLWELRGANVPQPHNILNDHRPLYLILNDCC